MARVGADGKGELTMVRRGAAVLFALAMMCAADGAFAQSAGNETPEQNVRSSQQYQQLLCTNKAFRANRIAKECGPLQGSEFYDSCVASFDCNKQPSGANWRNAPPSETIR
ncbi:MAG TPA: hypothetical protein VM782_01975 [Stellaceae bacterium]|nr:hypothetical protein [Stellaceae bacterium]